MLVLGCIVRVAPEKVAMTSSSEYSRAKAKGKVVEIEDGLVI